MNKVTPKVSIIIPVYNVAPYLRECMDSVVNQTLQEIEIICVNDGSTDESPSILEEYAQHDSRIQIISQENRGLSAARNVGIDLAKGTYVYFIDSDDILYLEAMEYLYGEAERDQLDVLHFDAETIYETGELAIPDAIIDNFTRSGSYNRIYSGSELLTSFMSKGDYQAPVWMQFYATSFLENNKLRFYEGIIGEDVLFTFQCMLSATRASHRKIVFYKRRIRKNSITTAPVSTANVQGLIITYIHITSHLDDYDLQDTDYCTIQTLIYCLKHDILKTIRRVYDRGQIAADAEKINQLSTDIISVNTEFSYLFLELQNTKQVLQEKERYLSAILHSPTYKIGLAILYLPMQLCKGVIQIQQFFSK